MTTVAIDFGTSNTVISILEPDNQTAKTVRLNSISRVFRFRNPAGDIWEVPVVPSLFFIKGNEIRLGEPVRTQRLGVAQPERFFKAFKRDLAADFQPPPRLIEGKSYTPELVSELFIQEIWQQLQQQGIQPTELILTVPVGAFERYLNWCRGLAEKLGVETVQLIDESTAAALGYAVKHPGALVLVVDFGGGTLDLSLVRISDLPQTEGATELKAQVLAKSDAYVGGEDIDIWIVEDYLQRQGLSREGVGEVGWQNLLEIAEKLKVTVSRQQSAKESWLDEESFMSYDLQLNREQLEEILEKRQFLEQLRAALDEVVAVALGKGISKSQIQQVLLVGGSCLIPAVQQLILSYFGRGKVRFDKPFEAVAHGALALKHLKKVEDYLRHRYAIRLWEPLSRSYTFFTLFDKGVQYPCQREEALTLQVAIEGQREIRLDIGEVAEIGQAEVVYDEQGRMSSGHLQVQEQYRALESDHQQVCLAHLDPPGKVEIDRISVQFEVDERRVLLATVDDLLTGKVLVERAEIAKLK